jgi:hypothetical protein
MISSRKNGMTLVWSCRVSAETLDYLWLQYMFAHISESISSYWKKHATKWGQFFY